jgi:LmbE family N-acetylglucosaminyl deacetylase
MSYDALVITAHPDDAETQMGGTRRNWRRAASESNRPTLSYKPDALTSASR